MNPDVGHERTFADTVKDNLPFSATFLLLMTMASVGSSAIVGKWHPNEKSIAQMLQDRRENTPTLVVETPASFAIIQETKPISSTLQLPQQAAGTIVQSTQNE